MAELVMAELVMAELVMAELVMAELVRRAGSVRTSAPSLQTAQSSPLSAGAFRQ
jgi:hypothetical protein